MSNQSNHIGQSQRTQTIKGTNHNSKHVADAKVRENVRERVTIGFGFASDWPRKWREFLKPITKRSDAKPNQTRITFGSQMKTALYKSSVYSAWVILKTKRCISTYLICTCYTWMTLFPYTALTRMIAMRTIHSPVSCNCLFSAKPGDSTTFLKGCLML